MRSEQFMHAITMFSILVLINQLAAIVGITLSITFIVVVALLLAFVWEFAGKQYDAKYISLDDILYGLLGAAIMILLFKLL